MTSKPRRHKKKSLRPVDDEQRRWSRRVPTPDDWAPTAEDGTVTVTVMLRRKASPPLQRGRPRPQKQWWVRTCVWGEYDMGMELDREDFACYDDALAYYRRQEKWVSQLSLIDKNMLRSLGFVSA